MSLIFNLLVTAFVVFSLTIVCVVWGRTTFKLLGLDQRQSFNCDEIWLGFSVLLTAIELLHLFVPIDWRVGLIVFASGLGLFATREQRKRLFQDLQLCKDFVKQHIYKILIFTIIAILWCLRAMGEPTNFDSGLYHFGSIRWMNEQPIVPGLANLHWRLGLNQSYFGFLALVNIFPLWNKGYAVGGLFLAYLTALTAFRIASSMPLTWRWIFGGLVFVYLGYLAGMLSNPSPDTAIGLLEIAVFCYLSLIVQISNQKNNSDIDLTQNMRGAATALILSVTLVTIKLSSVAFAVGSMVVVIYIQFKNTRVPYVESQNTYFMYSKLLMLMAGMSALHIMRGYLLSGAPFFPNTFAGAWGFDWAIPKEVAEFEANLIFSWARQPGVLTPQLVLSHMGWVSGWLKSFSVFAISLMGISTLLMLVNFIWSFSNQANRLNGRYLTLYIPIIPAFIFWFLTAPDVRFLGAVPVLFLSISIWYFYTFIVNGYKKIFNFGFPYKRYCSGIVVIIICLISFKLTGISNLSLQGWKSIPEHSLTVEKTLTNLQVNVPTIDGQCWNAPLPCASVFNGNLHADPIYIPWPLKILDIKRFFYSVKFLNVTK